MKKPHQVIMPIIALIILAWIFFLWREHARVMHETDQAAQSIEPTQIDRPDPMAFDYPVSMRDKKPKLAARNTKRFATERERMIWENTPDEQRAIQEAHEAGDFEEFNRLGMEFAMKMPWEWEPDPSIVKLREEMGWTNPPVIVEMPPVSKEESMEQLRVMKEYMKALQEWRPSGTNTMPPPPDPKLWKHKP